MIGLVVDAVVFLMIGLCVVGVVASYLAEWK